MAKQRRGDISGPDPQALGTTLLRAAGFGEPWASRLGRPQAGGCSQSLFPPCPLGLAPMEGEGPAAALSSPGKHFQRMLLRLPKQPRVFPS